MENTRRQKAKSTGDMFTFPSLSKDLEFESELADQLFANGRFRIHTFPVQPTNFLVPKSVILSRTSSFSSKGSLLSSRSNSTSSNNNSDSSSSNGNSNSNYKYALRSTSEASSRRKLSTVNHAATNTRNKVGNKEWQTRNYGNEYGHSHRWQFISPVPALNRRSNSFNKRKGGKGKGDIDDRKGVCRRFFEWLVSTCQECHAIEPSKRLKVSV